MRFIDPSAEQDEISENIDVNQPLYLQKLEEIHTLEEPYLNLNCAHLKTFDQDLYRQLICYPQEVIPGFDMAVNEMYPTWCLINRAYHTTHSPVDKTPANIVCR